MRLPVPITEGKHYVVDVGGCWVWQMSRNADGYGRTINGQLAHRRSFAEAGNDLPKGAPLDHLCRNRACINPEHLERTTNGENVRRGWVARGRDHRLTCANGHDLDDIYIEPDTNRPRCRACRRVWSRDWYRRHKAKAVITSMTLNDEAAA